MLHREPASEQLLRYKKTSRQVIPPYKNGSLTVGPRGSMLLEDIAYIEELANFDRERIPERLGHAKGAGAFGYFEVTHDITKYTAAKLFSKIGKKTPIAVRFSTVVGESGSCDTVRDLRGFAIKFYTDDGIWDLVGNNSPIFFIRDPKLFPSLVHALKRNPKTHLKDPDMFWDFATLRPETTQQILFLHTDRGIPDGYRHMNGYGSNTYKLVGNDGKWVYCKFHYISNQGVKNLSVEEAVKISGSDPDYAIRDLYNSIYKGQYPSWTLNIQVMTENQAVESKFNPFDVTKVWPHGDYPLIPVGTLVLNRNPVNYFLEIEKIAFSAAHMVPGIQPSPDKILLGRLFAYGDTQRYRLGPNYLQFPINCPFNVKNYYRDGLAAINNQGNAPNYHPNSFGGPVNDNRAQNLTPNLTISGEVKCYDTKDEDNFSQAGIFYRKVLNEHQKNELIRNLVENLQHVSPFIQLRAVKNFMEVDRSFGEKIAKNLGLSLGNVVAKL